MVCEQLAVLTSRRLARCPQGKPTTSRQAVPAGVDHGIRATGIPRFDRLAGRTPFGRRRPRLRDNRLPASARRRWPPRRVGAEEYESGHVPGAGFLDLQADFSDNDQPWRFMMPSAGAFAEAAGRHGILESSKLVLYDRLGSQWAARLWWMFRSMGCEGAVVLDGGWRRWTAEGRLVSTDPATYAPTTFTSRADPARFADLVEVKAFIESGDGGGSCLINALGREQHSGADGGRVRWSHRAHSRCDQRTLDGADRSRDRPLSSGGGAGVALRTGGSGPHAARGHVLRGRHRGVERRLRPRNVGLRECRRLRRLDVGVCRGSVAAAGGRLSAPGDSTWYASRDRTTTQSGAASRQTGGEP